MNKRGSDSERGRTLDTDTREAPGTKSSAEAQARVPTLTILSHPDPRRIGERAPLDALARGEVALSRTGPDFTRPDGAESWPLADPFLSRKPAMLSATSGGGVSITRNAEAIHLLADGTAVEAKRGLSAAELERGVLLELGGRVVLWLQNRRRSSYRGEDLGLVGESDAMQEVRDAVMRVADLSVPVLLRGQTGSGKELVAQAIHRASARAARPCLSVNMAALSPTIATSELFGHVKGAFTGAIDDHPGFFLRADGGTLFLDEIGEAPVEVQVLLLRVLETGTVQPVGGRSQAVVDVRLVAATDADLERAVSDGRFRAALLHRLSGYELHVPPLSARIEDLGRLFVHFAREEAQRIGESDRLTPAEPPPKPWIPAALMARLARYPWPGNVRQLRNVARQLVIASRGREQLEADAALERLLAEPQPRGAQSPEVEPAPARRKPSEVAEEELVAALKQHGWKVDPTAQALRISRASLYMLIEKSTKLRKAKDVPKEELLASFEAEGGDVERMAEALEVSSRGLYLRLKELGKV